ncbi:MAG: extracellular solute-binding protein [Gorillibacterium sp.]|nr:extracellular solute-binding protein [Gorillibacterium sp.]
MKKWVITLVSALLITNLAACSNTDKKDEAKPSTVSEEKSPAPAGEKTKLSYWTGDRHDSVYIKSVIDTYNSTNTDNIEVEYVVKTEEFNQAIDLAFASKQSPDIFRAKENTIQSFYKKGYIAPIDEYMTAEQKAAYPAMVDLNQFDGKMYSLPNYGSTMRLIYNVDLFKKAGIEKPPTSIAEMVEDAKKITAVGKAEGAYGFAQNFKGPESAFGRSSRVIAEASGFGGFGYDFKTARFDFSGFKDIINAFKQMKDDGSTLPGMESLDIDPLRAQFAEGKIGMYLSFSSEPGVYKDQFPAKIEWAGAPVPTIDGTVKGATGFLGGQWLTISADSPNKAAAWKFMNYMYGESILQSYQEQGFGISMVPAVITKAKTAEIKGIEGFMPNEHDGVWPISPAVNTEGKKYYDAFLEYMLQGGNLDKMITELNEQYNKALDKAIAAGEVKAEPNPEFDPAKLAGNYAK